MVTDTVSPAHPSRVTRARTPCSDPRHRHRRCAHGRAGPCRDRVRAACGAHAPHDVPIGAAGPQAASGRIADMLEQHAPGAFDDHLLPGRGGTAGGDPQPGRLRRHLIRPRRTGAAGRHGRQPDGRADADPGRQRHRSAVRRSRRAGDIKHTATADRGLGPADRRRSTGRRAGRVRATDHPGRPAAGDRAGGRAQARGVDAVHRGCGLRRQ